MFNKKNSITLKTNETAHIVTNQLSHLPLDSSWSVDLWCLFSQTDKRSPLHFLHLTGVMFFSGAACPGLHQICLHFRNIILRKNLSFDLGGQLWEECLFALFVPSSVFIPWSKSHHRGPFWAELQAQTAFYISLAHASFIRYAE